MKKFKMGFIALALVLGIVGSSFTTIKPNITRDIKDIIIVIVAYTSPSSSKELDESEFDEGLCPSENPEIVCARKYQDNVLIVVFLGGYYQGA